MRLYFDNNVYNRPFDDPVIPRNRDEARVVEALLEKVASGEVALVSSFVVEAENARLADTARRERVGDLIAFARGYVAADEGIWERASVLERVGFGVGDALHLAASERAGVEFFVTCDDRLARKARRVALTVRVVSPRKLIEEETL